MKTRKSLTKRFKVTKTGKILRRASGQNHFLAKKPGAKKQNKRKWVPLSKSVIRRVRKMVSAKQFR